MGMETPPIGGGEPPPVEGPDGSGGGPPPAGGSTDTITSEQAEQIILQQTLVALERPTVTIIEFAEIIRQFILSLKEIEQRATIDDILQLRDDRIILSDDALAAVQNFLETFDSWNATISSANSAVAALNNALSVYTNTFNAGSAGDQDEIDAVRDAITAWNALTPEEQAEQENIDALQVAIDNWNSFANTRNAELAGARETVDDAASDYNGSRGGINSSISAMNDQITGGELNLPARPLLTSVPSPVAGEYPTIDITVTATTGNLATNLVPATPGQIGTLTVHSKEFLSPIAFEDVQPALNAISDFIELYRITSVDQLRRVFEDISPMIEAFGTGSILPDTYIERQPEPYFDIYGSPGANVGLAGLNVPSIDRAVGGPLFESALELFNIQFSGTDASRLAFTTARLINLVGLSSLKTAVSLLGTRIGNVPETSSLLSISLALANVSQVSKFIDSPVAGNLVERLLNRMEGVSAGQRGAVGETLTSIIHLSLAQVALFQLARAVGVPGLTLQLFSEASGVPKALLSALAGGPKLFDALEHPIAMIFLKATVQERLESQGIDSVTATRIASHGIDGLLLGGPLTSVRRLLKGITEAFMAEGLDLTSARELALLTITELRGELGGTNLDSVAKRDLNLEAFASALQALEIKIARSVLDNAVEAAFADKELQTQREIRNRIADELKREGIREQEALFFANQAIRFAEEGKVTPTSGIGTARLRSLQRRLGEKLGGDATEAVSATLRQGPFASEAEFQAVLVGELTDRFGQAGIQALGEVVASLDEGVPVTKEQAINGVTSSVREEAIETLGEERAEKLVEETEKVVEDFLVRLRKLIKDLEKLLDAITTNQSAFVKKNTAVSVALDALIPPVGIGSIRDGLAFGKRSIDFPV